jgi:dinuclear metal center YbgI/SA1388 family protein
MAATIADIILGMNAIAPPHLAEKWDNVGLQVGDPDATVRSVWIALDPLPEVVAAACDRGIDLLITHHPLFFKPLGRIDFKTPLGNIIKKAVSSGLAIFSAHTNLDSVKGGVNDVLAQRIGLRNLEVLGEPASLKECKLVIFVPQKDVKRLRRALFAAGAGQIGNYSECSFATPGQGTFRSGAGAKPALGTPGKVSRVDEIRVETVVPRQLLTEAIESAARVHPYETMAWDAFPLLKPISEQGIGRIGHLGKSMDLEGLVKHTKTVLGLDFLKTAGRGDLSITSVALCSGSGSSLVKDFLTSDAQVYISGDLGYHDARMVTQREKALIDIGHFNSEHLIVTALVKALREKLEGFEDDISIEACPLEEDPFAIR